MDVLPTLPKVDAVVTDPPYGVNYKGSVTKSTVDAEHGYSNYEDTPENVETIIVPRFILALSIADRAALTPGIANHRMYPKPSAEGVFWYPAGANAGPWGFVMHQPIFYYGKCTYLAVGRGSMPTGFKTGEQAEKNGHPCPKPIRATEWMVNRVSIATGETILDPFMGSGTTGVACVNLGRKFIGIEKEPKYFDIACERITRAVAQGRLFSV
jgi:DNA modification methylase